MKERTRILLMALVMSAIALGAVVIAMASLYQTAFEGQQARLHEIVSNEALIIESISAHELRQQRMLHPDRDAEVLALDAALEQIRQAHEGFAGFGETGEFTMARRVGGQIVFVLRHRHGDLLSPAPVPFSSDLAEPMRRALSGQSGTLVGLDYRGERVMAAYQPVRANGLGLVAKVDLAEVRRPFISAGLLALGFALLLITGGTVLFLRIGNPIIEKALATTKFLDTVIDRSPFAMWISDTDGTVFRTNRALQDNLQLTDDQIVGKYNVLHDENLERQGVMPLVRAVFEDLAPARFSIPWKANHAGEVDFSGGRDQYIDVSMFPKSGADGTLEHVICQWVDITDQKRAEHELRELSRTLEDRVKERTVELTAANKELEAFAYSVSHDLRSPLRGIDGFSKALLDDYQDKLDDTGKDYLNRVRAGTQRMGTLIDDLLELSRLTRTEMHRQRLDLGEMARKITIELQRDEPDRRAEFEIAPGLTGSGDRVLVEAALENLLRNAWKFTGQCERATIEVGVTAHDGERVYHVRDNGAGFDMAYADKLFGPFQRLHDATEYPGTGIGLAIVHRVILRHGGRVWAEGEVDKGATFYFTLPTASGKADQGA